MRARNHPGTTPLELDARDPSAVKGQATGVGTGQHGQVAPVFGGTQKRLGSVPSPAFALIHLEIVAALVVATGEVLHRRDTCLIGGLAKRVENLPRNAQSLDAPLAARAVKIAGAAMVIFHALVQRQHVVPAPAGISQRRPAVIVLALAAHVDHSVDRRTAPEHAPAGIAQLAPVQAGIRRRLEHPVRSRVADAVEIADRDVDPVPVIRPPGLQQQHAN